MNKIQELVLKMVGVKVINVSHSKVINKIQELIEAIQEETGIEIWNMGLPDEVFSKIKEVAYKNPTIPLDGVRSIVLKLKYGGPEIMASSDSIYISRLNKEKITMSK